jgi:hypothetical protein
MENTLGNGVVPPSRGGDARNPVLGRDRRLVDGDLGETSRVLVPFERMRGDARYVDFSAKVAREVAKVRSLFDDGAGAVQIRE